MLGEIATLISLYMPSTKLVLDVFTYGSILYICILFICSVLVSLDKDQ
jgi:hypothetical protein